MGRGVGVIYLVLEVEQIVCVCVCVRCLDVYAYLNIAHMYMGACT